MYDNGSQLALTGSGITFLGMAVGPAWLGAVAVLLVAAGLLGMVAFKSRLG